MMKFDATIEEARGGGAVIEVPAGVVESLGGGARIPVVATFDGINYSGSIVRMGGRSVLGVLKAIRSSLGKGLGDRVTVTIERDRSERNVEIPVELAKLFKINPVAAERFEALSYSHQREHAHHVGEAKKDETRQRRAQRTVERLLG